jgi:hypothetical protein
LLSAVHASTDTPNDSRQVLNTALNTAAASGQLPEGCKNLLELVTAAGGRWGGDFRARAFGGAPLRYSGSNTRTGGGTPNSINMQCGGTISEGSISVSMRHRCNRLASKMFSVCNVSLPNK